MPYPDEYPILFQLLYRLPMFADALMDLLAPSDCSLLMMMSGYRPAQARVANLLDIHREFIIAGLDMVYSRTAPYRRRDSVDARVTLDLIGKDIAKIVERISDPKTFWKDRSRVEDLYIYIDIKSAGETPSINWIQPNPGSAGMQDSIPYSMDSSTPRGWLNVNPDLSSPLKLLTVEPYLTDISQMSLGKRMEHWCRPANIIDCLMSSVSNYQPMLPYKYRDRKKEESTDYATMILEAREDRNNRYCFRLIETIMRMQPPLPPLRDNTLIIQTTMGYEENKALGLPNMLTCFMYWIFPLYDSCRIVPFKGEMISLPLAADDDPDMDEYY